MLLWVHQSASMPRKRGRSPRKGRNCGPNKTARSARTADRCQRGSGANAGAVEERMRTAGSDATRGDHSRGVRGQIHQVDGKPCCTERPEKQNYTTLHNINYVPRGVVDREATTAPQNDHHARDRRSSPPTRLPGSDTSTTELRPCPKIGSIIRRPARTRAHVRAAAGSRTPVLMDPRVPAAHSASAAPRTDHS